MLRDNCRGGRQGFTAWQGLRKCCKLLGHDSTRSCCCDIRLLLRGNCTRQSRGGRQGFTACWQGLRKCKLLLRLGHDSTRICCDRLLLRGNRTRNKGGRLLRFTARQGLWKCKLLRQGTGRSCCWRKVLLLLRLGGCTGSCGRLLR